LKHPVYFRPVDNPYDIEGVLLVEGDNVIGASGGFPGECGIVVRASGGALIHVRVDSSGQVWGTTASLWRKRQ